MRSVRVSSVTVNLNARTFSEYTGNIRLWTGRVIENLKQRNSEFFFCIRGSVILLLYGFEIDMEHRRAKRVRLIS